MKVLILLILILTIGFNCHALPDSFIRAINQVEAGGHTNGQIIGDCGKAIGPLQIHYKCWKDTHLKGKYSDCYGYAYSIKVANKYLAKYGQIYIRSNNFFALARIWNGGPNGIKNPNTLNYAQAVVYQLLINSAPPYR